VIRGRRLFDHQLRYSNLEWLVYLRIQGSERTGKKVPESSTTATQSQHTFPGGDEGKQAFFVPDSLYIPVFLPCLSLTELVDEYDVEGVSSGVDVECAVDRSEAPSSVLPRRPPSGSSSGPSSLLVLCAASGTGSAAAFRDDVNGRRMAAMSSESRGEGGGFVRAWSYMNWFAWGIGYLVRCGSRWRKPSKEAKSGNEVI
jgi:hypothetical protein